MMTCRCVRTLLAAALLVPAARASATEPADAADAIESPKAPEPSGDQRRTMKGYRSNLAYNFLGIWTPGNYGPLLATVALTAPAFAWDDDGVDYFRRHPHEQFGKIGAQLGGGIAVGGLAVGFFSAGRFSHGTRFRASTYDVSQAVIINQVYTQLFKFTVRRERPDGSNRQSFPSGHASNAFAAATVITRHYPKLTVPGYAVATYIAFSRMAANRHHFSDIVAGAGFGFGVGRAVVRRNSRPLEETAAPTAHWGISPDGGPQGDGRGVAFVFTF
jgi:membrane-associated phospholipid phosphatase